MSRTAITKLRVKQRRELESMVGRRSEAAGLVRRTRVILLSADGLSGREIALRLSLSAEAVSRIRNRFRSEGVAGLQERPKAGRKDHALPPEIVEKLEQPGDVPAARWAQSVDDQTARRGRRPSRWSSSTTSAGGCRRSSASTELSATPSAVRIFSAQWSRSTRSTRSAGQLNEARAASSAIIRGVYRGANRKTPVSLIRPASRCQAVLS